MAGAWYILDGAMCVVKTATVRLYGAHQWCPDAPTIVKAYNVHEWNRLFPGYHCPAPSHCPVPATLPPSGAPVSGGSPSGGGVVGQGASGVTSGVAGAGKGRPVTGPAPKTPEPGCAPAMAIVSSELGFSQFAGGNAGGGSAGGGHGQGFGHSELDQLAQPMVAGLTPLAIYGTNGRPTYNQAYRFRVEDELGHKTVHSYHEGAGDGLLCIHPPELQDYMLHGSGVNPGSRWPTTLSEVTLLLHNCTRADATTGDSSVTRLAFGNPLKTTVKPKDGCYFSYAPSTGILSLVSTESTGADDKVGHFRVDMALDVPQYSDAEQALIASQRAGTLVWNTDDEEYQYWDGAAWTAIGGGGAGDMLAANNLSDLASDDTSISNLVGGGTSRTPTELHEVGITDINALGTAHGRCSIAALRQQVVTADNTLIHAFGSDSTDGPWRRILSRNFSTGGAGALETAMTITKPAADATITLRISITGKRSDSAREYRGNFIVGFEDTGGTLTADGTDWSAEGGGAAGSIVFSFDASGNDMRIRVNDSGDLFRLGIMVEVEWRTSSA